MTGGPVRAQRRSAGHGRPRHRLPALGNRVAADGSDRGRGRVRAQDPALLLRAVEVFEVDRLDFAEAFLVASAETTGVARVASFDKTIDRVASVERVGPLAR
jgi:predicted nucleic acid-binding protein